MHVNVYSFFIFLKNEEHWQLSGFGIYFGYSLLGYILWFGYFDGCHDILGWKISLLLDCLIASI